MEINVGGHIIIVHEAPLEILRKFTQLKPHQPESGGIILGKVYNNHIEIVKLSVPTSLDKSSRYNFERNKISAQIIIDYEFSNSQGQVIYLGEWHTHPESNPKPSGRDLEMIKNQFKFNKMNVDFILLIIKGTEKIYFRILTKSTINELTVNVQ